MRKITSYNIDDKGTLHTYIENVKHVTFENVNNDKEAELLIKEENEIIENKQNP